jgi:hypothetical protein
MQPHIPHTPRDSNPVFAALSAARQMRHARMQTPKRIVQAMQAKQAEHTCVTKSQRSSDTDTDSTHTEPSI